MVLVILTLAILPGMRTEIQMLGIGILILNIVIALQDVSKQRCPDSWWPSCFHGS